VPEPVRAMVRRQIASSSLLSGDVRRKLRHTFLGRTGDLHAPNFRKIRVIGRHRGCHTRICLDFPGMLRIGFRYPDER